MSDHVPAPTPEEPEILIQDLEDVPAPETALPHAVDLTARCARCSRSVPGGTEYCDACLQIMRACPIAPGAWVGAALCVLAALAAAVVLCLNLTITWHISRGDAALAADDLKTCYAEYRASYTAAAQINGRIAALLDRLHVPHGELSLFSNGSHALDRQILAMARLNGPYEAGEAIERLYGERPPQTLKAVYAQYKTLSAYDVEVAKGLAAYRDSITVDDPGDYNKMAALADSALEKVPQTPDYMAQFYRFHFSFMLSDDPARTCRLLDQLIDMAPDAHWLWASEGIHAYDQGEEYVKALSICNRLMKLDAGSSATVAYTMMQLRLLGQPKDALDIYDRALALTEPSSEMQRQKAIVLMLDGTYDEALELLTASYSPQTATLEHLATIALCAYAAGDEDVYLEYKAKLDGYRPFEQVDLFVAGNITLEDIFLVGGGEVH